jgi:hypothetical protein
MQKLLSRFGWLIILAGTLSISWWSLYFVARHEGAPAPIAGIVSTAFDGVALLSADYALRYARMGLSGIGPRITVYLFAGISAYINSRHAVISHEPGFVELLWGVPSVGAILVYEFHVRWERRNALSRAGRTAAPLPTYGVWTWVRYPRKTLARMSAVIDYRADAITARNMPAPISRSGQTQSETLSDSEKLIGSSGKLYAIETGVSPEQIRTWAIAKGHHVNSRGPIPADLVQLYYSEIEGIREAE